MTDMTTAMIYYDEAWPMSILYGVLGVVILSFTDIPER